MMEKIFLKPNEANEKKKFPDHLHMCVCARLCAYVCEYDDVDDAPETLLKIILVFSVFVDLAASISVASE